MNTVANMNFFPSEFSEGKQMLKIIPVQCLGTCALISRGEHKSTALRTEVADDLRKLNWPKKFH